MAPAPSRPADLAAQLPYVLAATLAALLLRKLVTLAQRVDAEPLLELLAAPLPLSAGLLLALGAALVGAALLAARALAPRKAAPAAVHLLDFAVHRPPESWRFPRSDVRRIAVESGVFSAEDIEFQEKVAFRAGLGDHTYVTPALKGNDRSARGTEGARREFAEMCLKAVDDVLEKTGVKARDVRFVITNSSLFNPTPSLAATVMNHLKSGPDTLGYSLGGQGCSAGVVAIDLARQMLELYPDSYALVVSHENITNSWYDGRDRSMQVPNTIFRANGSALLLTNKRSDAGRAKYRLEHLVRTTLTDDEAFNCIRQTEDDDQKTGVRLTKELIGVAGRAMRVNLTKLGPKVLPLSEKLTFAANMVTRKLASRSKALAARMPASWTKAYTPSFAEAFDHVCLHTGGRAVLDTLEKQLSLPPALVEPSRAALYRYGNTSSTSIWYGLAYIESQKGVRKGDRVWQVGFGSGFKCNSAVWVASRRVKDHHFAWEGFDLDGMARELSDMDARIADDRARRAAEKAAAGPAAASH